MKDYKFRVWDSINKKMDYDCRDLMVWNGFLIPVGDNIIMQYTGIKDSKRADIYEGDILKATDDVHSGENNICIVEYKGSGFWAKELDGEFNGDIDGWVNYDTEIIGNIYKNPELLKVIA